MATETENGRIVQDTDDSTPEPSFYDQKDARQVIGKIISSNFAVMVAGLNDAATGVLIPYIQPTYDIGLLQVSFIYLVNFTGWLCACFANIHVCSRLGTGGTLLLGATVQCLGYALMFWHPPYPLFMAAFFFTGMGVAFQDAQANAFTITVKNAHRWLGILHAVYGLGTIIAPLIANTIASRTPEWHHYYLIVFCVGVVNILLLAWTFRRGLFRPNVQNAKDTAGSELKATLANRSVWILNGFFFLYAGAEVASGGWIVQFIVSVRHGDPKKVGYIASGFWTGFTVGRVLLADITHKFGERRMVFIYLVLALAMQLMFWIVPSIPVNAVAVFLLGFFIGPFYPVGLYVLTEIVPPELHVGAIGFTASLGQAGSAAFPFMTGAIASKAGVQVLQPIMVGLLIGIGIFWAFIPKEGKIRLEDDDENGRLAN
ncbi:major facilitator superfamily domain-containing protein [Aspergillus pseudonomiae]|uniref:Major facilitator superfamily domain-containing protein n=1 Tax=Aspergillus pseudonomiae TaxID=1506151 RepID=A0A5N6IK67_9EURO|nr:major facilitator superfamily domain-containing protein [Aspergillus pseudonomiae]KAB8266259.1 major facilitator superfamily domain-containing protein [Aspergillus pseudonomiae]KAE8398704.1 major facilitator superfamily domain-containing protein [Aspergillus pseudonomiae]